MADDKQPREVGKAGFFTLEAAVKALRGAAGDNSIDILVSSESIDREGESLLAAGCVLDNYLKNPVVLWQHSTLTPPIARAAQTVAQPGIGVMATWDFAPTPFAQEVRGLYQGGFLNAASHGFRPLVRPELAQADSSGRPAHFVVSSWELLEQSAVAVPANALALAKAYTQGSDLAAMWLAEQYPDLWGTKASADPVEQAERVRLTTEQRIADALQRLKGGAETLRNHARHQRKAGAELGFDTAPLAEAIRDACEVAGEEVAAAILASFKSAVTDTPEPNPAAVTTTDPPAPEPNPAAGAPSEQGLSSEVLAELASTFDGLGKAIASIPDQVREAVQMQLADSAKSYIGRRVPERTH